jgi:hypothetical protein
MAFLKGLVIGLPGLIVLLIVVSFFLPSTFRMGRLLVIID